MGVTGLGCTSCLLILDPELRLLWHAPWVSSHQDGEWLANRVVWLKQVAGCKLRAKRATALRWS